MIPFWAAAVALSVWGIQASRASYSATPAAALEILARRFAAGEIDRDEFQEQRELLENRRKNWAMRAEVGSVAFRLRSAAGHLDGVVGMVDEDRLVILAVLVPGALAGVL